MPLQRRELRHRPQRGVTAQPLPSFPAELPQVRLPIAGAIARLAHDASFEMAARDLEGLARARDALPRDAMIAIAWHGDDSTDQRIAAARAIRDAGFEPLPHIAARRLRDGREADALLRRLRDEAGVSRILLINGHSHEPAGEFASALELLVRFRADNHGLRGVGLGGHPEGNARTDPAALDAELDTRLAVAEDAGLEAFVVTRFAFDAAPILAWLEAFRARGHQVPVRVGVAGPATIRTLMRSAALFGVGPSVRGLVSHGASLARMLREAAPDPVIRGLAEAHARERLGPLALHLYPFGGLERTARWIAPVAQGHLRLRLNESGFEPEA